MSTVRSFEENLLSAHIITRISNGTLQPSTVSAAAPPVSHYWNAPVLLLPSLLNQQQRWWYCSHVLHQLCNERRRGGERDCHHGPGTSNSSTSTSTVAADTWEPCPEPTGPGGLQTKSVHLLCSWQSAKCLAQKGKLEVKLPAKRERRQATWRPQSTATHGEPVYRQGSNPGSKVRKGFQNRGCLSHWEERPKAQGRKGI